MKKYLIYPNSFLCMPHVFSPFLSATSRADVSYEWGTASDASLLRLLEQTHEAPVLVVSPQGDLVTLVPDKMVIFHYDPQKQRMKGRVIRVDHAGLSKALEHLGGQSLRLFRHPQTGVPSARFVRPSARFEPPPVPVAPLRIE